MATQRPTVLAPEPMTANGPQASGEDVLNTYVPEAVYWEKYYDYPDINYEWNNGQLEVVPVADHAKYIMYLWFLDILRDFLRVQPIARIIGLEVGFRLALPTKTTIRKPDLGLVLHSNPAPLGDHDCSYRGVFDLCVESLSDSSQTEIDRDTIIKRDEYAAAGVQEYYILDERGIDTQFYRLTRRGHYQPMPRTEGVIRSVVLPGFQFRIQDLYDQPDVPAMALDPVYSSFISPHYRAERQRAERAEVLAGEERQRANKERQRAEQYALLLKEAGLLPPE